jgi:excisionase family DNA binding protein
MVDNEFLTVDEVAARLKLNPQTVRNWISAGALPAVRAGRRVRVRAASLEAFLEPSGHAAEDESSSRQEFSRALTAAQLARTDAELAGALRLLARAADSLAEALSD